MSYLAGLDVGQVVDHMALVVVESMPERMYEVAFIYRWPLGLPNQIMIRDIKQILSSLEENVSLNVDYTGKGQVFAEFLEHGFQQEPRLTNVMTDYSVFSQAMKQNLASNIKLLLGEKRLLFRRGEGLHKEMLDELFDELCNYQLRITESQVKGKPTSELGALGYNQHDDLATALLLALEDAEQAPSSGSMYWIRH